ACHDGINFATGGGSTLADTAAASAVGAVLATSGHVGRAQATDTNCFFCHAPADIKVYHRTLDVTKNNPTVTPGLKDFRYDIKSATVSAGNDLAIVFRILARTADANGVLGTSAPVTLNTPASPAPSTSLTGFTGGPSFLLAWAMDSSATDGIATPADYNNAGKNAAQTTDAQATSVTLASFMNSATTSLALSARDADGYYTATIKSTHSAIFPVGAKMRAVAMQSYYTQVSPAAARHAPSVVKEVTGDAVRRKVVDAAKCTNCHEWLELHGGSRVLAPETTTVVCAMCHNPRHTTSGRGIPDATVSAWTFNAADTKILNDWNFNTTAVNAALAFPATSNNLKDMIHGIHAGRSRVTPFLDVRDRTPSAITVLDFSRLDFPGHLNKCETCHISGTYGSVPAGALPSTQESVNAAYAATPNPANAKASRLSNNPTDIVTSPFAAACVACHDSAVVQSHMNSTGIATIKAARSSLVPGTEQCAFCHGPGKIADVTVMHNK
ncbi:MAG: cytochrome C, partial [Betaproteobacteria bacterium]|nr:cytochrome C [Betaproteobacteria bacterium]